MQWTYKILPLLGIQNNYSDRVGLKISFEVSLKYFLLVIADAFSGEKH